MLFGSPKLLCQFRELRKAGLDQRFKDGVQWHAHVAGPMQCMLKGVCAQCLQWQIDPLTKERTKAVYACSWQDQPFDKVDIMHYDQRLTLNDLTEQINSLWLDYLLTQTERE